MADLPANNATFASVLAASAGGDTILLADEIYDDFTRTTAITRSPRVTIKPANKNGVRFKSVNANNAMFQIQGWNGFNIEGLIFDGTDLSYTGTDGKKYPNGGTRAVKSHHCSNITWRDILIDFLDIGIETGSGGASSTYNNNIVHEYCELTRMGMDGLRVYNATNGYTIRKCYLHNFNVNRTIDPATGKGRHYAGGRHVDGSQGAVQNQDPPSRNLVIEDNYYALLTGSDGYSHGIFYLNDRTNKQGATTGDIFYENMSIQRNYVETGHTNAIAFSGARGTLICRDNCCRTPANGYDSLPTINIYRLVGTSASKLQLANNVRGRDLGKGTNGTLDQNNLQYVQVSVAEPDIVSTSPTTFPVGWNTLGPVVPGGALTARTVGRYAYEFGGPPTEVQPTTPTVIGSPGTATGHGRVEPYYSAGLIDWTGNGTLVQAYSGVLVIPPTSPAWTAASGAPANLDVQWKRTSHTNWRNCRIATPPTNAATSMRFEMLPSLSAYNAAFPDDHRDHAVQAGGSMADVEWRYKPKTGTLWSEKSTYVSGFTAPAATTPCSVTSALHGNTGYTVGGVATANFDYTIGSGTFTSLKVDWFLDGVLVETDSGIANGVKTASYTTTAQGALTYRVTLVTSVNTATLTTATSATVSAAPVAPSMISNAIANNAYTVGQTATVNFDYNLGNGAFTSLKVEWFLGATLVETDSGLTSTTKSATYVTTATGNLTAKVTIVTSAGSANTTSGIAVVGAAPVAPVVGTVTPANGAYTVGQTAVVNFAGLTLGNGTFTSLVVEWYLGAGLVRSDSIASNVRTASYVTAGTGNLTAKVIATTSNGSSNSTSAAMVIGASPVAPDVTNVVFTNTAYLVGQTSVANLTYAPGNGTFVSLVVEWYRGATLVETDNLAAGATSASYVNTAPGTLTAKAILTTSAGTDNFTSIGATVSPVPVAPDLTSGNLDKSAYTLGDTAVFAFDYNLGNGAFVSLKVDWYLNGALVETDTLSNGTKSATYVIPAIGQLQAIATLVTSVSSDTLQTVLTPIASPAPNAPDADDWTIVAVVAATGFTDRFTAQIQFPIGTNVTETAVIGVDWTMDGGTTWRHCISRGLSAGRTLWELGPGAAIGDQAHTVGFEEASSNVRIRIATSTGTSPISPAPGQSFVGPLSPPIEEDDAPAAADADWLMSITPAPGLAGYFTGLVQFTPTSAIDDGDVVSLEWAGLDGAWRPTAFVGLDGGERTWRLLPLIGGGTEHLVTYGLTLSNVRIRYSTATGISPASTGTKQVTAPMAPPPVDGPDPDEILMSGASPMVCAGLPVKIAGDIRPGTPPEEILPVIIEGVISIVLPSLPTTAVQFIVSYAGRQAAHTGGETWAAAIVPGHWGGLITAFDAHGRPGVSAIFFVEAP